MDAISEIWRVREDTAGWRGAVRALIGGVAMVTLVQAVPDARADAPSFGVGSDETFSGTAFGGTRSRFVEQIFFGAAISDINTPLVVVVINDQSLCSGVLVSRDTVLTAAHCVSDGPIQSIVMRIGGTQFAYAVAYQIHPSYIPLTGLLPSYFDIAAIKLDHKLPRSLRPATFASRSPRAGENIFPLGYGLDEDDNLGVLRIGVMQVLGDDGLNIYASRPAGGSSTCNGDSGGPAFVLRKGKLRLVGVTAFGSISCTEESGFASIFHRSVKSFIKRAKRARR